ncbi:hypothetical protein [Jeotgalibacillus sp. R-1-5s-1]|uniref:hypothetical protein n=1 Tax=Jeotgalibacillus sp. R-1-5s-1 TaxID=2555897 RepID=UPI00106AFA97|nr:hypothetical protein [Jeotgalibacillus sp. R-1-5s-1]TFD99673.1 hypothetical protein E2491_07190 [Jeotgalibacillus sp. R-1-5s-1]
MKSRAFGVYAVVFGLLSLFDLIQTGEVAFVVNLIAAAVFALAYYLVWTKMGWFKGKSSE